MALSPLHKCSINQINPAPMFSASLPLGKSLTTAISFLGISGYCIPQSQMAHMRMEIGLVMALVTMLWTGAAAQSSCTTAIISLSPCLSYIQGNSSTPSSSCCSQLASVVSSSPQCLCTLLNGGSSSLGMTLNQTQALALPGACNVQTPPASQCNGAGGPTTSAAADSPAGTPTTTTSGGGSKAVPTTGGNSSDGSTTTLPISILFTLLFIATYASTLTSF
ncbi:LTP_2 domain-containing protein [Cinnamomum micranthum f. kanehirae]|uniref:LTP_2 domain-containing protein n=1 Tax=Cinnamomum micranthum f. kanehirae TaxID=337451 RepID=A0A3S3MTN7_9MAGN|nr:LTP_2 domain-containing protein [Cinnamomum micranthum f. kanehirae]